MATESESTLWLIPARGGSKGIPGKNIKPLCGLSPLARSIRLAYECRQDSDIVFVSTEDPEIAALAVSEGCEIPFLRPRELAEDSSTSYDVIIHAINEFKKRGKEFSRIVLLQPTSPLRIKEDVENALSLWSPETDMVVSVCESSGNPYYNLFEENAQGYLHISKGDGKISRRQDAPRVWEYNGAVYVISTPSLIRGPFSTFERIVPSPMPRSRSLDLDSPLDWQIAEILLHTQD